jgi:hypothetical protein
MKCEACLEMMDELIERELDDSLVREVNAHIAMCAPCSQLYAQLRYEQELYGTYLQDVEPTPALWANLRLELQKERIVRGSHPLFRLQRWLAIAFESLHITPLQATALVLMTIGLAVGLMVWRTTIDTSPNPAQNPGVLSSQPSSGVDREGTHRVPANADRESPAKDNDRKILPSPPKSGDKRREIQISAAGRAGRRTVEKSPAVPTVDQVTRRVEQQYLSAIEILSRDIKRRRALISPALLSQLEMALTDVDRNIAATGRAAREQPRDPLAVQYLAVAYEKKIELLREVTSR